jgi:magnesium transporter
MLNEKILFCLKNKDVETLKTLLTTAGDMEILHVLHSLFSKEQVIVFRLLPKDKALSIFEELDTDQQQNLLKSFTDESTIEFVNELAPDDRVRLLDELPATMAKKLMNSFTPQEREVINLLLGYEAETAGRIMTPEFISLKGNETVDEALDKVRNQAKDKETIYTLYITSTSKKLEGVVSLKELLTAKGTDKVADVMSKNLVYVSTDTDQEEAATILKELDLLALPVVDKESRLVGIVTIDDAVDILEEEATEDILDAAGFADIAGRESNRSEVLTKGSIWRIWAVRLPFLVITLIAGMAAGLIIEGFEDILESVVIVAFFIPLIMDMGGNVGTQSSTVFARGVVLGHINIKQFMKPFLKELGVGLSMGIIVGTVAGGIITLWLDMPMLGIAVALALLATMTLAALLGFLVPFTLMKLKVDQAAGSAPIITSIKDISGLFIYFALIILLMGSHLEADYEVTSINVTKDGIHFYLDPEEETAIVMGNEDYLVDVVIPEEIEVMGEVFVVIEDDSTSYEECTNP